jgi:hypothetical protein
MQVAGEVYGPVLSCSALRLSTFVSAHAMAVSTADLTLWATSETMVVAVGIGVVGLSSVEPSVVATEPSDADAENSKVLLAVSGSSVTCVWYDLT